MAILRSYENISHDYLMMQLRQEEERMREHRRQELKRIEERSIKRMSYDDIVPFCLSTEALRKEEQPNPLLLLCRT